MNCGGEQKIPWDPFPIGIWIGLLGTRGKGGIRRRYQGQIQDECREDDVVSWLQDDLQQVLRELCLCDQAYIPQCYLSHSDPQVRWELLRGIIYGSGRHHQMIKKVYTLRFRDKRLVSQFRRLASSLTLPIFTNENLEGRPEPRGAPDPFEISLTPEQLDRPFRPVAEEHDFSSDISFMYKDVSNQ